MRCLEICFAIFTILLIGGCGIGKQAQLDAYVASEKQKLPKVLFDDAKVVDLATGDSEIIYVCEAKGMDDAAANAARNQMRKKAEGYARKNQQALKRLIDAEIKMTFVARSDAGDELFRFSINPWEL